MAWTAASNRSSPSCKVATWSSRIPSRSITARLRRFGTYPLVEDNTARARASSLMNAVAGYQLASGTRLQLSVLNLLNERADDIQYSYPSRLRGEASDGVDDVHFHPAEPRQVRIAIAYTP